MTVVSKAARKDESPDGIVHRLGNGLNDIDHAIGILKPVALTAILKGMYHAKNKFGYAVALLELYLPSSGEAIMHLCASVKKEVYAFFQLLHLWLTKPQKIELTIESARALAEKLDDLPPGAKLQAFEPLDTGNAAEGHWLLNILDQHMHYVRPLLGLVALIAAAMGWKSLIGFDFLKNINQNIIQFGAVARAKTFASNELNSLIDSMLTTVYKIGGKEYVSEKAKHVRALAQDAFKLHEDIRIMQEQYSLDTLGALTRQNPAVVEEQYMSLMKRYAQFTIEEKSMYNLKKVLDSCFTAIENLQERRAALMHGAGISQEPTRVWLFGEKGTGKTNLISEIMKKLEGGSLPLYSRNDADDYMSGYKGQPAVLFDDIFQNAEGTSVSDWHRFASGIPTQCNMAAVEEKGMYFNARYMFASSNFGYARPTTKIADVASFDRRRDFVIYVTNEPVRRYKATHHQQDPPIEFWKANPSRFFLCTAQKIEGMTEPTGTVPQINDQWCVTELAFEDIIALIEQKEREKRERFRQRLVESPVLKDLKVTLPTEPIEYDKRALNFTELAKGYKPSTGALAQANAATQRAQVEEIWFGSPSEQRVVWTAAVRSGEPINHPKAEIIKTAVQIFTPPPVRTSNALEMAILNAEREIINIDSLPGWMRTAPSKMSSLVCGDHVFTFEEERVYKIKREVVPLTFMLSIPEYTVDGQVLRPLSATIAPSHADSEASASSSLPPEAQLEALVNPRRSENEPTHFSVLLLGEPGTGKTRLAKELYSNPTMVDWHALETDVYYKKDLLENTGVVIFDDAAASTTRLRLAAEYLQAHYECRSNNAHVILTANHNDIWDEDEQLRQMMERRCLVIQTLWKTQLILKVAGYNALNIVSGVNKITPSAYIEKKGLVHQDHVRYQCEFVSNITSNSVASDIRNWLRERSVIEPCVVERFALELPQPEAPTHLIMCACNMEDVYDFGLTDFLSEKFRVFVNDNGKQRKLTAMQKSTELIKLSDAFSSAAPVDLEEFVITFNKEKHVTTYDGVAIVQFHDCKLGFFSESGFLFAFRVNNQDRVTVEDDDVYVNGSKQDMTYNSHALRFIKRAFGENLEPAPPVPTEETLADSFISQQTLTRMLRIFVPLTSLFVRALGVYAILSSGDERSVMNENQHEPENPSGPTKYASIKHGEYRVHTYSTQDNIDYGRQNPAPNTGTVSDWSAEQTEPESRPFNRVTPPPARKAPATKLLPQEDTWVKAVLSKPVQPNQESDSFRARPVYNVKTKMYGIFCRGRVTTFQHVAPNYTCVNVPTSEEWEEVSAAAMRQNFGYTDTLPSVLPMHEDCMRKWVGTVFVQSDQSVRCDALLVGIVCFGIPLDISNGRCYPDHMVALFKPRPHLFPATALKPMSELYAEQLVSLKLLENVRPEGTTDLMCEATIQQAAKNHVSIIVNGHHTVFGVMTHAKVGVTVNHIKSDKFKVRDEARNKTYNARKIVSGEGVDLCLFEITDKSAESYPDIRSHFATRADVEQAFASGSSPANFVKFPRYDAGKKSLLTYPIRAKALTTNEKVQVGRNVSYCATLHGLSTTGISSPGDCGSLLVLHNPQLKGRIAGVHRAGSNDASYATIVTREWIVEAYQQFLSA